MAHQGGAVVLTLLCWLVDGYEAVNAALSLLHVWGLPLAASAVALAVADVRPDAVRTLSAALPPRSSTNPLTCPDARPDASADARPDASGPGIRRRFLMRSPSSRHYAPDTLARPPHWGDGAACQTSKTPDYWFADGDDAESVANRQEAKRVCARCPARPSCLHDALERREPSGVWGGLDTDERNALTLLPAAREPATEEATDGPPHEPAQTA
ncbi:WhiB family transcriptional regulator [Streptomyces sp. NPDC018693]|uniref:WhiB family transcriptional regulator n=1 Tax=unclassified Streptomyces TaxID=2593676 RepID=UPI00379A9C38